MIDTSITVIADRLNQYLKNVFDLSEDVVVVSNILEQDGSIAAHIDNKVVVFLVNIEKESIMGHQPELRSAGASRNPSAYPPLRLNLYLMFAASFGGKNYPESLKFISQTVSFFQRSPVFDHQTTPELDDRVEKLVLDMENISFRDLSSLWGVLSGKYLPSVLYKVRMLTFHTGDIKKAVSSIQDTDGSVRGR
ncbi:MAG: DUF4255 domain-containing protein [Candidatus Electrothrix aestuarii]|uniref:DUF4255 domain-containing protein n=1 Tax=Candidatus Electrothrix aestuarii TaxID=3062594 RepID=A0AAU8LW73_9BACT|nr:DUF4255 domain-containing protein [Candidatus Electrothrix aestuarii]